MAAESGDSFSSEINFSVQKIPTSNLDLSVDERWLAHFATAQKQLVIRIVTINIVSVDTHPGCYYIKPSFLAIAG